MGFSDLRRDAGIGRLHAGVEADFGRLFQSGLRGGSSRATSARSSSRVSEWATKRPMRGGEWVVVGNFDLGQTEGNCAVYADADTIMSAFGRTTFSQVAVVLRTEESFAELARAIRPIRRCTSR